MEFITLLVITFACLLSDSTRKFGTVLLILLFLAYPLTFITLTAIALYFINRHNPERTKHYEPPTLPRDH